MMSRPGGKAALWLKNHAALVGVLMAGGLALVLYARTIGFGFFGDDPSGHFRYIEQVPWPQWFTSSPGFFFRPLVFFSYRLLVLALGGYVAPGFHAAMVALHVSNTVLVGVFAGSISRRPALAGLAAMLFAAFPLSHEAIAGVDALAHPLLTLWVLLALVLFERGCRTGKKAYLWAVHPIVLLAILTHENGLIIPVLLLLLQLLVYPPGSRRELFRLSALQYFVVPVLYVLWWLQIPKDTIASPQSLGDLLRNTLPFLQVAAYPILPFVRLGVSQWGGLLAIVGLALLLTYGAARVLGTVRLWLFGVAWMAVVALPSILFLDWDYLHGSPHLYYLAAVGAALIWAMPPIAVIAPARGPRPLRLAAIAAGVLLALAILLPSIPFVSCHLDLWQDGSRLVRLLSDQASEAPAERELLFVNLPTFFTSNARHPQGCPAILPFVTTGVVIIPPYALLNDFIRVNGGPDRPARGVTIAEYISAWPPRYGEVVPVAAIRDLVRDNQVAVFEIDTWSLRDLSADWQPGGDPAVAPLATFGQSLALEGFDVVPGGDTLQVALQWQLHSVPPAVVTAFVHVYDRAGNLLAQHDGPPGRNGAPADYVPLSLWQAGDRIRDVHTISLAAPLPPEGYTVAVGLYDSVTVERLPALDADGAVLPDNLYVLRE